MLKICLGAEAIGELSTGEGTVLNPETCCSHSISFEAVSLIRVLVPDPEMLI